MGSSSDKEDKYDFLMTGVIESSNKHISSFNYPKISNSVSSFNDPKISNLVNQNPNPYQNKKPNINQRQSYYNKIGAFPENMSENNINGGNYILKKDNLNGSKNINPFNNHYLDKDKTGKDQGMNNQYNFQQINIEQTFMKNNNNNFSENSCGNKNIYGGGDSDYSYNNVNNVNNEDKVSKLSYPNLSEINIRNVINQSINDSNINILESKDLSLDYNIPNQKFEIETFSEVEKSMKEINIQDDYSENENDKNENKTYKELQIYEKEQLKKIFLENKDKFEKNNFDRKNLIIKFESNLISNIIKKENTKNIFKKKIIDEIGIIKSDENKYKIDHLTILLVGKTRIRKKSLIKYMLKLEDFELKKEKQGKKEDFQVYQSLKVPYLRLVKYKGIGIGKDNYAETIANQTINYIKKQNKKGSYNDFVNCIWYCVTGSRMETLEDEYLIKLRNAYSNANMPIILIYLDEYMESRVNDMKRKIRDKLDVDFINVISRTIKKPNNSGIEKPRGDKELMNLTLAKCQAALQGDMPKIMMKNISYDILFKMKNLIETNKNILKESIKEKYINEFKNILKNNELIDYIINLLGRNLRIFYDKDISNKSLNLIINSEILKKIKIFMNTCKNFAKSLISSDIISKEHDFIDRQAYLEKKNKENINIENKISIKGFIKSSEIYLKKNYYYISQKYIIYYLILYYCNDYFNEFQKQFNDIIDNLINSDEDSDINKCIADCFGVKLKKFGEKMKFNFDIKKMNKIVILIFH